MNSRYILAGVLVLLVGLGFTRPIYEREVPMDRKQIGEDSYLVFFEDGSMMKVDGLFLSVNKHVGVKLFGIWEVRK